MARRVIISIVGDAASYAASLAQSEKSTLAFQKSLKNVSVDARATAIAVANASATTEAALRKQIVTYQTLAAEQTQGSSAQQRYNDLAAKAQTRLARLIGAASEKQIVALQATADVQIRASLAKQKVLREEITQYAEVTAAAAASAKQQSAIAAASVAGSEEQVAAKNAVVEAEARLTTASALAAKSQAALNKETGVSASIAAKAEADLAAAAAEAGRVQLSAAELAQMAAKEQIAASVAKIATLKEEIATYKAAAAAAVTGSEEQIAASTLAAKAEASLARQIAATKHEASIPTPMTNAEAQIAASVSKRQALREEILSYRAVAASATSSAEEQVIATQLAAKSERALAREMGELSGASKAVTAQLQASAAEQVQASIVKRKALEKEILDYKAVADAAVMGSEEQVAAANLAAAAEARLAREIAAVATTQEVAAVSHVKAERQLGKATRGALAGSGLFRALGRSLAFASGGFLAFAVASQGLRSSVDAAMAFQAEMEQIHTQAGASTAEVEKMSGAVKRLAPSVGIGPEELAKGLFHIESAGLRGAKALNVLRVAAMGAQIGHANLEDTTNALIATQASGITGVSNMSEAMGVLNAIVGQGNMRMSDLVKSLSTPLLSAAKFAGLSITDVGAALSTLSIKWGPNSNAATRLAMSINLLASPTKQATKELLKIGLSATALGDTFRHKGLIAGLELLKKKLNESGLSLTQQNTLITRAFGGGRSSGAIKTLLDSLDLLPDRLKKIQAGIGGFGEKWRKTQKTAEFATLKWHASMKALETELGADLLPIVTKTANRFSAWMSKTKNQVAIQNDFKDALKITGGALKTIWFFAKPLIDTFNMLSQAVGGARRSVELIIAAFVAYKLALRAAGDATVVAEAEATGFFSTVGTGAEVATAKVTGLKAALLGTQNLLRNRGLMAGFGLVGAGQLAPHVIPGRTGEAAGGILTSAGVGTMIGSFFRNARGSGALPGALLGVGMGIKQNVPGKTGNILGNVAMGAGIGATAGLIGGPLAPVTAPMGAAIGAAGGLAISLFKLGHSAESAADALKRISKSSSATGFAVQRGRQGVIRLRGQVAEDRVAKDEARAALAAAKAEEVATRGTREHAASLNRLKARQAEYGAASRAVARDIHSIGSALQKLGANTRRQAQFDVDAKNKLVALGNAARVGVVTWTRYGAVTQSSKEKVAAYITKMDGLAQSMQASNPRLATVAARLAQIAAQTHKIPRSKTIDILLKYAVDIAVKKIKVNVAGGGVITVTPGINADRHNRMSDQIAADAAAAKDARKGGRGGPKRLPPIRVFNIPQNLQVQQAQALNQKQDIIAARKVLNWVQAMLRSGRLVGQALIDALNERRSLLDTIASAAKKAKKKAASTSISKLVPSGIREQVSKAGADFAASGTKAAGERLIKALKAERVWITHRLAQGHFTGNQRVALENEMKRISTQIGSATKKFIHDHWTIPISLQLAQAKADAAAAMHPEQTGPTKEMMSIAQKLKKAAKKAIHSHSLSVQGLIDAWNAVLQANQVLAQKNKGMVGTYHAVSSQAFTAGLGLTGDARKLAEERYAQTISHRGYRPSGPAAQGQLVPMSQGGGGGVNIGVVHVHGIRNVDQLYSELEKKGKQRGQRRGLR